MAAIHILLALLGLSAFTAPSNGDPRATLISFICNRTVASSALIFATNTVDTLNSVSSLVNKDGYAANHVGTGSNAVYYLVQCYGDLDSTDCPLCFSQLRSLAPQCFPGIGARAFMDGCFMRYENYYFLNEVLDPTDSVVCNSSRNSTDRTGFGQAVRAAVGNVSAAAPGGMGFAVGSAKGSNMTVYALAQCWKSLDMTSCSACLEAAAANISLCSPATEGRALYAGCYLRYSTKLFWNVKQKLASPVNQTLASPPTKGVYPRKRRRSSIVVIVAVSLAVTILGSVMLLIWIKCKYTWTKPSAEKTILPFGKGGVNNPKGSERALISSFYPLSDIIKSTDNFSDVNKLGEGGFGPVYKGQLMDGREIAVKKLAAKSRQGREEFENEITLIAKLQHRNLVGLLGYCIHGEERMLIYEYMPNRSLDNFLFDTTRRAQLDWSRRLYIIEGISQGLLYLHKHSRFRIIHRDLKASNILLDADMRPKISDFGMARIFVSNEPEATNRIVGTYGYMSPEYAAEGIFSIKSDVFSFGVLLLEIVSGRRNTCYHRHGNTLNLLGYTWELWKEAKWSELVDPSLNGPMHEISRCIHVALMCVQESATDRPNMSAVIAMLSGDSAIPDPKQPAFFHVRNLAEEELQSVNEVTVTDLNGR